MEHNELFGEFDAKKVENKSSEEYTVYEWAGKQLYKKTYSRKYFGANRTDGGKTYTDSYVSEAVV